MKRLIFILILLIPFSSGLIISEIELNPLGSDSGNEWIEFYSGSLVNGSYKLINNDAGEIELNLSFEGYFVHVFETQWLDNSDERVYLYKEDNLIDSTPIFEDSQNDDLAFSFCENWEFLESSKEKENNCLKEEIVEEIIEEVGEEIQEEDEVKEMTKIEEPKEGEKIIEEKVETIEKKEVKVEETIILTPQSIKREKTTSSLENKWFYKYSFGIFAVIILFLFTIKRKKKKNEWRE